MFSQCWNFQSSHICYLPFFFFFLHFIYPVSIPNKFTCCTSLSLPLAYRNLSPLLGSCIYEEIPTVHILLITLYLFICSSILLSHKSHSKIVATGYIWLFKINLIIPIMLKCSLGECWSRGFIRFTFDFFDIGSSEVMVCSFTRSNLISPLLWC